MSNRTSKANRAILSAWEREQELVRNGQGTRDWTQEQQQDILERGKAYDVDGRAFEGHHMKSAEAYPQYQGDPENIQFLSRIEHGQAHDGWQKPTNGYYDYLTGITYHFDEEGFLPCKIIVLSDPIIAIDTYCIDTGEDALEQVDEEKAADSTKQIFDSQQSVPESPSISKSIINPPHKLITKEKVINGLKGVVNTVREYSNQHPVVTAIVEGGVLALGIGLVGKAINTTMQAKPSTGSSHSLSNSSTVATVTETALNAFSKFDFMRSESALKQLGYAVSKTLGLSDEDRRKILDGAMATAGMTKEAICAFLEKNITLHKNQTGFSDAVRKWTSDLAYLRNKP